MHTKTLLFVCTGNTCRSPLAKVLAERVLKDAGSSDWTVDSAGLAAYPGSGASEHATAVARELGLDLTSHQSKALSPAMVTKADLVLVMTEAHKAAILQAAPNLAHKVLTLREYAGEHGDVPDPFGGSQSQYRETSGELLRLLRRIAEKIKE